MTEFNKKFATIFTDESGQNRVMFPSGEVLPCDIKSTVIDEVDKPALCRITFLANICQTEEQAKKRYNL